MEGSGSLSKKSKILLALVVMVVIAALIVGSTMLGSSPEGSDEGTDEPLDQVPIATSTADMILPLSSLTSDWIIGSDPGSVSTTPSAVEESSASYESRDAYYTEVLSVYVMKFDSVKNASDAYWDQFHQKEDKYSVSSTKIGNSCFEYEFLDRVFT
jgi:hypothetical protein